MERGGHRVPRTYRQVRPNTIVVDLVVLGDIEGKAFPPFDAAPESAGVRVGIITCGGSVYNSGHPNLIKGFPDIQGAIGSGHGAPLKVEQEYLDGLNRQQGLHVSTAEKDMNAGRGNSRKAFVHLVEDAWNKAVSEAKEMVQVVKESPGDIPGVPTNRAFNPMSRCVCSGGFSRVPEELSGVTEVREPLCDREKAAQRRGNGAISRSNQAEVIAGRLGTRVGTGRKGALPNQDPDWPVLRVRRPRGIHNDSLPVHVTLAVGLHGNHGLGARMDSLGNAGSLPFGRGKCSRCIR